MKRWLTKAGLAAVIASTVLGFGCAEERAPISRVQANALKKDFFVGEKLLDRTDDPEFYYRGTVVDVGYGAAQDGLFTSTYAQPISRIKWEISEDTLTARLAYQRIPDSDGHLGTYTGAELDPKTGKPIAAGEGQVVAAFRIQSQFDIRRAYNPSTGEELNIVEENASDRPWYEREYFRVDWSKNLVTDAYDFDTLSLMGIYGGINYEPLSYYVDDPTHPDAPHFDDGYFDITQRAFAVPKTIDLSSFGWGIDSFPACMLDPDFMSGSGPTGNCNPVELKLRLSFSKVVDDDYEPADWDGLRFGAFGAFTDDRKGYLREYGTLVDDRWHRFAARYNIWEKSHTDTVCNLPLTDAVCMDDPGNAACTPPGVNPHRDDDNDGTEDECAAVSGGSRCDVFVGKCTIPFRQRVAKPVIWHIHENGATDMFAPTEWATLNWDVAMRAAVQTARYAECMKVESAAFTGDLGAARATCAEQYPMWTGQVEDAEDAVYVDRDATKCYRDSKSWGAGACAGTVDEAATRVKPAAGSHADAAAKIAAVLKAVPTMVTLCHNPVVEGDHPGCGPVGSPVRFGDLRYHHVNIIHQPQTPSAWGIMTDGNDPLSGKHVSANINIWNHVTDMAAQGAVDIIRVINGEIPIEAITNGKYIQDFSGAMQHTGGFGVAPTMDKQHVIDRLAATAAGGKIDRKVLESAFDHYLSASPAKAEQYGLSPAITATQLRAFKADTRSTPGPFEMTRATRAKAARNTPFEAQLINKPMLEAAGITGGDSFSPDAVSNLASPFAMGDFARISKLRRAKELGLAARGACMIADDSAMPEFSSIVGFAQQVQAKFGAYDPNATAVDQLARVRRMQKYLARIMHYGVIIHEMGHSIGERHNFVSSVDAFTFRPQYWQLRSQNGEQNTLCTAATTEGASCVGPRYFDPITPEETTGMLWMWQQSSVMDYPGDITVDMMGLGAYDFAAARMFYGDVASVYDDMSQFGQALSEKTVKQQLADKTDDFGGLLGIKMGTGHYSAIQKNYQVIRECEEFDPAAMQPADWNEDLDGAFVPELDGHVVNVKGKYTKCRQHSVDYVPWTNLTNPTLEKQKNGSSDVSGIKGGYTDPQDRRRVPYCFASDNRADIGNVSVFRHDQGADPYEQVMFMMTAQESRHIFDHYRRGRTSFAIRPAMGRDYDRYLDKMVNIGKSVGLYRVGIEEDAATIFKATPGSVWWGEIVGSFGADNVLAASVVMDHITRQLSRPTTGGFFKNDNDPVMRPVDGYAKVFGVQATPKFYLPNGIAGFPFTDVGFGAQPINNYYDDGKGDYAVEYQTQIGSYYQKIMAFRALTDNEDRFVNANAGDFTDGRWRTYGLYDLFPDGYRRLMAAVMTEDALALAPRLAAKSATVGDVEVSGVGLNKFPTRPIGWTSWWPEEGPRSCFSLGGSYTCARYHEGTVDPANLGAQAPEFTTPLDPQIGWEEVKFAIAYAYLNLPGNQRTDWLDQLAIYRSSINDPELLGAKVVFRDPLSGTRYFAHSIGKDKDVVGNVIQAGVAARVLERANQLAAAAFVTTGVDPQTGELTYKLDPAGNPIVAADPTVTGSAEGGECNANKACHDLKNLKTNVDFMWLAAQAYQIPFNWNPKSTY